MFGLELLNSVKQFCDNACWFVKSHTQINIDFYRCSVGLRSGELGDHGSTWKSRSCIVIQPARVECHGPKYVVACSSEFS